MFNLEPIIKKITEHTAQQAQIIALLQEIKQILETKNKYESKNKK